MAIQPRGPKFAVKVGGKYYGTRDTRKEAERLERRVMVEREDARAAGLKAEVKVRTCADFAENWIADYCFGIADATLSVRKTAMRKFAEEFGSTPLTGVTRSKARKWAITQSAGTRSIVRKMYNDAKDDDFVTINPFAKLGFPESRGRKDITVLTRDELHTLADSALIHSGDYGPTMRALILFAGYTGMRPGEDFALEHRDIGEDRVRVRQSVSCTSKLKEPKNGKQRTIVLPAVAAEAIRDLPRFQGIPYVFTSRTGVRLNRHTLDREWEKVRRHSERPDMDFYELRHFCATYLLNLGVPHKDVAIQLGHTDGGALVMSTYGHPSDEDSLKRVAEAFAG